MTEPGTSESEAPLYPPGEFARVELPGYVAWTGWVAEDTLLKGAARHLAAIGPDAERPVYVLATGHDLGADDAERIQRAVAQALRDQP